MNPSELVAGFRHLALLFEAFRGTQQRAGSEKIDFIIEANVRAQQLAHVLARFVDLEHEYQWRQTQLHQMAKLDPQGHDKRADALREYGPLLELQAESFYLFAWRFRRVVREIDGFDGFDAAGVRDVRNWLIEHPEKKQHIGVMARTFVYDCPEGLILKPFGGDGATRAVDKGLYPNAAAFIEELLPLAVAASKRTTAVT